MKFILDTQRISTFNSLREEYQALKKVNLKEKPSMFSMPTSLGGTDVKNRDRQISFLEKVKALVSPYLLKHEDIQTLAQWQANLMALRIFSAACLYVLSETNSRAKLKAFIREKLGITAENYFDNEDKEICFKTTHKLIDQIDALALINTYMRSINAEEFTKEEWNLFSGFILAEEEKINKSKQLSPNYPVTNLVQPIFEASFTYVGMTLGRVTAEVLNSSSVAIGPRIQFTAWVGSALMLLGPTGATGVALVAPTIAAKLFSEYFNISLTIVAGKAMGLVGKGTGMLIGLPLDLLYNLLWAASSLVVNSTSTSTIPPVNGIRIADGAIVINGHPMQFTPIQQKQLPYSVPLLQIKDNGELSFSEELVELSGNEVTLVIQNPDEITVFSPKKLYPQITEVDDAEETAHTEPEDARFTPI